MNNPIFQIICGIPSSGKSTYVRQFLATHFDYSCISPDTLRQQLTGSIEDQSRNTYIFNEMIPTLIEGFAATKTNIIYDATNVTRKARNSILTLVKSLGYETRVIVMRADNATSVSRNLARERVVPEFVMNRMIANYQEPDKEIEKYIDSIEFYP